MKRLVTVVALSLVALSPRGASTAAPPPTIAQFDAISAIKWTDADHVIFEAEPQEWTRWSSVSVSTSAARLEEFLGRFLNGTSPRSTAGGQ